MLHALDDITERQVWSGARTRVVYLEGLPQRTPPRTTPRTIDTVVVHSSGGSRLHGLHAPHQLATWDVAAPTLGSHGPIGGGLGLPHTRWHYVVPSVPGMSGGRYTAFQTLPHGQAVDHGMALDTTAVHVVVAGLYRSRHGSGHGRPRPDSTVLDVLDDVVEYLVDHFGVAPHRVLAASELGQPASPGDEMEHRIRALRGEAVFYARDETDVQMDAPDQWCAMLRRLGYEVPGEWSDQAQTALRYCQDALGLRPDGVWGPLTQQVVSARCAR